MKRIALCCHFSFSRWKRNPRIICIFILMACYIFVITRPIANFCAHVRVGCSQWLFPFITSYENCILILMCLLVILLCDLPPRESLQKYVIIRAGKMNWLLGQFAYISLSAFLFWAGVAACSILFLMPHLALDGGWGKVLYTLAQPSTSEIPGLYFPILREVTALLSPPYAYALAFLLAFLVSFFIGSVIMYFNMSGHQSLGVLIALALVSLQHFAHMASGQWVYNISPVSWVSLNRVDFQNRHTSMPDLTHVIILLVALNLALILLCVRKVKNHAIDLVAL